MVPVYIVPRKRAWWQQFCFFIEPKCSELWKL